MNLVSAATPPYLLTFLVYCCDAWHLQVVVDCMFLQATDDPLGVQPGGDVVRGGGNVG